MMGMPDCREVARRLSAEQDISRAKRGPGMRMHLLICASCRAYAKQLRWLRAALQRALADTERARLSASARARIRNRLRQKQR